MINRVRKRAGLSGRRAALAVFVLVAAGCGGNSADQAIARREKELNLPPKELVAFAGTVTVDGLPPQIPDGHAMLVALCGPNDPPPDKQPPRYAIVQKDGKFQFREGGVAPGTYIAAIAILRRGRPGTFRGPDVLSNLYNDPEQNANLDGFKFDVKPHSKSNVTLNLAVAGKEPVTTPGPKALIKFFGTPQ